MAAATAFVIFVLDTIAPQDITFAIFYVAVLFMAGSFLKPRGVWLVFLACAVLTSLSYVISPPAVNQLVGLSNTGLALLVMAVTAFLVVRRQAAIAAVTEQAELLDLTHDPILVLDMNDTITFWNRSAAELYGWSAEEAVGAVSQKLLNSIFPAPFGDIMAELLKTGRWDGELVRATRRGVPLVLACRWSLKRDEQGQPLAILETSNNITEHREAQERLREARDSLARINRVMLMSELGSMIAHEVKQPIAAAAANAEAALQWLGSTPPDTSEAATALEGILGDCHRATEIIGRVTALVKKEAPHKDFLDLNATILDVLEMCGGRLNKHHVVLRKHLSPNLPEVEADRVQLQQVVLNLANNAIDAMSAEAEDARELTVTTALHNGHEVIVEVRDSGPGLDATQFDGLFHPFQTTKADGVGLGLTISRSIVEAHNGRIWAEPSAPHGAVFRFTLPVRMPSRAEEMPSRR